MNRIYLRAFEPSDYILINKWRNDPEISKLLVGNYNYVSLEREKHWVADKAINDKESMYFAICLLSTDEMIGYASLMKMDLRNQKVEVGGFTIGNKSMWRQGYSKEAHILLFNYVFNAFPINKIKSHCLEEHYVTIRTLTSLGFKQEGILKEEVYKNGEFKNLHIYSVLRSEYKEAGFLRES
ncbi:MAG: GNAT family N-acetyltransferase [Candidatus Cloacimonetes bacterium]|nr:GNAT family N-acetyltransferase [Candidatus Cloacimonadota bacterium]